MNAANHEPIYVTRPAMPPLDEFLPYLQEIWGSGVLTNNGPFHQTLEKALSDYLGLEHIALMGNGTLALMTALQCLRVSGEVITTPFSFVATTHSLLWNGICPVFTDIEPESLNLNPERIEAAITPKTTAIMPVHCYGNPCATEKIQRIADNYGLKVIYDAAHAFAVRDQGGSILRHGDLSVLSFHATKIFNTFEGGAIVCHDAKTKQRINHLKNFGFVDETAVVAPGINGKMNEIQSAFGLLQLKHVDQAIAQRKQVDNRYRDRLRTIPYIRCLAPPGNISWNYSYFPIFIEQGHPIGRDGLYAKLKNSGIYCRRYFHPLISDFPMYRWLPSAAPDNLPVARRIASEVLCLPLYPSLTECDQDRILEIIETGAKA